MINHKKEVQKSLIGKVVNCFDLDKKHKWSLIGYTDYTDIFECVNCGAKKKETAFNKDLNRGG